MKPNDRFITLGPHPRPREERFTRERIGVWNPPPLGAAPNPLRQTGRTSRTLEAALWCKMNGGNPTVIVASYNEIRRCMELDASVTGPPLPYFRLGHTNFASVNSLIRSRCLLRGVGTYEVFVDHLVWESGTPHQLNELDRQIGMLRQ